MADNSVQIAARQWVDSLERKWRLQILSQRYRYNQETGERVQLPTRIRRFVEGIPVALVDEAMKYLLSKAPYKGIIYNGVQLDGEYRPTLTTWQRDDNTVVNGGQRTDGTYTLVQDLTEKSLWDHYLVGTSRSCTEEVQTDWTWDSPVVESLPETGDLQGVTWAIQSVNRNEDGTFNYALVKRTAKTQHTPRTTASSTAMEVVETESWNNLYGEPPDFTDENGDPVDVPAASYVGGVRVEVQVAKNDDCTYRASATWTSTRTLVAADDSTHTQYEGDHTEQHVGSMLPLGVAPDASGGVIKTYESQQQPDGTFKTVEKTKVERPVPESTKQITVGRRGRRVTTVNTNQLNPADTTSIDIGGSVKVEKTPGRRYTNTITTWDADNPVRAAESCTETIFNHKHSNTTSGIASMPSENEHVYGSGVGGLVVARQTDMDEEGSISQTVTHDQEKFVESAEETWQVGLTGLTHSVRHQNVSRNAVVYYGTIPTYDRRNVGQTLRREKTPGGLYNVTISQIDRQADNLKTGAACSKSAFLHTDRAAMSRSDGSFGDSHVPEAKDGVYVEQDATLNSDGSSTVTTTTNNEIPVANATVTYRRAARGLTTTIVDRNQTGIPTEQVPPAIFSSIPADDRVGDSVTWEMTNGKLYNITRTKIDRAALPDRAACDKTVFEHQHENVTMGTGAVDTTCVPDAGNGVYYRKTSDLDDNGFVRTVERQITEIAVADASKTCSADYFKTTERTVKKNQLTVADKYPTQFLPDNDHTVTTVSTQKNNGGSYDVTVDVVKKKFRSWDHVVDTNYKYSKTVWFVNANKSEKDDLYTTEFKSFSQSFRIVNKDAESSEPYDHMPSSYNIQPNVTVDEHGLYSGSYTFSANWETESAGREGELELNFFWWSYNDRMIQMSAGASDDGASFQTTTIDRHVYCASGRGAKLLVRLISGYPALFSGTSMTYNPITQGWHVTLVNSCDIKIEGGGV